MGQIPTIRIIKFKGMSIFKVFELINHFQWNHTNLYSISDTWEQAQLICSELAAALKSATITCILEETQTQDWESFVVTL